MAKSKNYQDMSIEELEAFIQETDEEVQKLIDIKIEAHEVLDQRNAELEALRRLETMSDPERAALFQHMKVHGIASEEAAGNPG